MTGYRRDSQGLLTIVDVEPGPGPDAAHRGWPEDDEAAAYHLTHTGIELWPAEESETDSLRGWPDEGEADLFTGIGHHADVVVLIPLIPRSERTPR